MSGRAAWGGIAGAANALQAYFAERRASDDKAKLYAQEQDIMQKREEALAQIRANLQDTNAAHRSDRAMNRDEFKHGLTSGDVTGAFKDEETGSVYGRTKDGNVVPLNITSDDYQDYKKRIEAGKAASGDLSGDRTQAQIDRTNAQTTNLTSQTTARDNKPAPDKMGEEIRKSFQANFAKAHDDWAKQAAAATKAGQPAPPFDPSAASDAAKAALYPVYGGDAVNASVGAGANKPKPAPMAAAPQPTAGSPTQQGAPSLQDIMNAGNAANKAGKDPAAVDQWVKGLMQKYGYDNGDPRNAPADQIGPPSDLAGP